MILLPSVFLLTILLGSIPSWFGFVIVKPWQFRTATTTESSIASTPERPSYDVSQRRSLAVATSKNSADVPIDDDATMATALCVIPPDSAWDTIQRARHVARDRSYFRFPPAIRLFHPFCPRSKLSDAAMDVANLVERYNMTPFSILLNQWVVIPHWEALEADWEAMQQIPVQQQQEDNVVDDDNQHSTVIEGSYDEKDVERLIQDEERVGVRRKVKRLIKRLREQGENVTEEEAMERLKAERQQEHVEEDSPQALLEKQKQMYEEFNGPCVVCLEPDEASRHKLTNLREILCRELFPDYEKYSPSSSVSETDRLPKNVLEADESNYRPLVPIGAFPTVSSAIEMARKLRGLWDPLSFNVTDLHIISQGRTDILHESQVNNQQGLGMKKTSWMSQDGEQHLSVSAPYGCDAMIRLIADEIEIGHDLNEKYATMKNGMTGGYEAFRQAKSRSTRKSNELSSVLEPDDDDGSLDAWLEDDEDWDEGTVMVFGRTHFFTGEKRVFDGMPAASSVDSKDKTLGEGVSGAARRRASTHRQGYLWQVGEFGRRDSDFSPQSKRSNRRK